jgi:hypothetical protein
MRESGKKRGIKLYNEELHNLYFSTNILRSII